MVLSSRTSFLYTTLLRSYCFVRSFIQPKLLAEHFLCVRDINIQSTENTKAMTALTLVSGVSGVKRVQHQSKSVVLLGEVQQRCAQSVVKTQMWSPWVPGPGKASWRRRSHIKSHRKTLAHFIPLDDVRLVGSAVINLF